MDTFLTFFGALFAACMASNICSVLWFTLRWYVFGWRPKILDEDQVTNTVEECAETAVRNDALMFKKMGGVVMTEDEKREHLEYVKKVFRMVIERYIQLWYLKP